MNQQKIFRMAAVLGDSSASNFRTNLKKIVKLILFDNYGKSLKISEIIEALHETYMLEFAYNEVEDAIKNEKGIVVYDNNDDVLNQYTINPAEYEKMKNLESVNIDKFIRIFIENSQCEYDFDTLKELIYKFLYNTFNADKNTVLELMNFCNSSDTDGNLDIKFEPDEARIINDFLNWDYKPKNEFVLNLIASCFDYCMLTVKKNTGSFSNIFGGKEFYLDSNIIFRLAGFNNKDRKSIMNAFINKCVESGIIICYTNHTAAEITNTIRYHVKRLKNLLGSNQPLSVNAMRIMGSKYSNLDFYEQYTIWCKTKGNRAGDYEEFNKYLEKEINLILKKFKKVVVNRNYEINKNCDFREMATDFSEYKEKHYRNTYKNAIDTDINNYLYMVEQNNKGQATNFMDMKYYFITADHCLTEWAMEKRPGTIPIFVLPSVWYSILLKYKGRSDDDYNAFCQFLNIRIAPEKDRLKEVKEKIFPYIMNLNEEREIKEEIIYDIEEKLNNTNVSYDNIEELVEESHNTILASKIKEIEEKHSSQIDELKQQIKEVNESKETKDNFLLGQSDIINRQAKKIVKRRKKIAIIGWSMILIGIIVFVIMIGGNILYGDKKVSIFMNWLNDNQGILAILGLILEVIGCGIKCIIGKTDIFSTDIEKVEEKLREKYNIVEC